MPKRMPGATHNRSDARAAGAVTATSIGAKYLRKPRLSCPAEELKNGGLCVSIMPDGTHSAFTVSKARHTRTHGTDTARHAREVAQQALRVKAGYIGNVE